LHVTTPEFVVAGHVVRDLVPDGWRLGGTVTFAAVQAHRLGLRAGVVTCASDDVDVAHDLPFADVVVRPSSRTTTFENVYDGGHRTQRVIAQAEAIRRDDVPHEWRSAPIVLLGPIMDELEPGFASTFEDASLVGVSAQGWLRSVDDAGNVVHTDWTGDPFWRGADVLFVSDEDIDGREEALERWLREVPVVAMTESWKGARVYAEGAWRRMDAFPEDEVDPTGAGDTFAAAFLVRLRETNDVGEAARFGAAAASISVGAAGTAAMPSREDVEERLRGYPQVALR
jgi:sugar/nucleoside kinase (ribokinase family)